MTNEVPLPGGDVTEGIVRVGGTVRRPLGPHSPLVHAVLGHLESVGFEGAPRFLGLDDRGREVLTFVEGEVAGRPHPAWLADDARLASVARLLRAYDDAVAGFEPPAHLLDAVAPPDLPGMPPEPSVPDGAERFIGHLDVTPENVVFRGGQAVALIDFDLLRPATRVDEVVNLCLHWAPLSPEQDRSDPLRRADAVVRTRLVADAYGLDDPARALLVPTAIRRTERSWHLMRHRAQTLGGGWARMWADGVGETILRRLEWLNAEGERITVGLGVGR
ncbi:phosphotransferase [Sinomonas sp. ASV486]|uniref:phosphotransferase n=1 Tax=Sinomonas sp. ASV486 TaxID=3051170 RepID=UPI0027DE15BE|nr:phosphotransferase [Sinomonas sp. ASV486]MDQ4491575.1 phosphotransferase [Sinomonas sp. ASV486]